MHNEIWTDSWKMEEESVGMERMKPGWIRWVFAGSALYDGVLGLAFLFAAAGLFETFSVTPPNHFGYVQFPALLLIIFAGMFGQIAADPLRRREWIPYGTGLKVAYCVVVFYHYIFGSIPFIWVPFAYADLAFLALFLIAWHRLGLIKNQN